MGAIAPSAIAQAAVRISFGIPGSFILSFDILFSPQKLSLVSLSTKNNTILFPCQQNTNNKKGSPFTIELGCL
ncbi:hypothetical protein AB1283_01935 [Bacillus sp. S13(2024)]|uniref:hypothetical protein n=1 Tax=unclassified Bacillus (in: firmicutes) TaxID=185979 RepID=UPI003D1977C7